MKFMSQLQPKTASAIVDEILKLESDKEDIEHRLEALRKIAKAAGIAMPADKRIATKNNGWTVLLPSSGPVGYLSVIQAGDSLVSELPEEKLAELKKLCGDKFSAIFKLETVVTTQDNPRDRIEVLFPPGQARKIIALITKKGNCSLRCCHDKAAEYIPSVEETTYTLKTKKAA
ncbi:hypothetical protein DB346_08640 [Verrucomicrobia bacterium LW23]|nr:hypothetical protein DB346_08640 [Verrucomicrobia bacterium LW23]